MFVWTALAGAALACSGGEGVPAAPPNDSPPASAPSGDPWAAVAGGPSLEAFVVERARRAASTPWQAPDTAATRAVADLSYGQQRAIRFRSERAIWRGEGPFELQFFHPSGGFRTPVGIHLVEDGASRTLPFDPALFTRGDELDGIDLALGEGAGWAGFRALAPLNEPHRVDEVVSFLGASYFRLLGPGHVYGLSARGIAVDVAAPGGEEFPDFREFWLVRPVSGDSTLTFHGLLDGPSLTGAIRFDLTPGRPATDAAPSAPTVLVVDARLFARRDVAKLGVAPLTSMYLHGTFRRGGDDDVRPRVHDSEGLLMATSGGEWIWRPLTNRRTLQVTSLRDRSPRGWGLVQRERDFEAYLDLEAEYHRRPSLWVEPLEGDWGVGGVELVEIPTPSEFNDNIVAAWTPDGPFPAGTERRYRYRIVTFDDRWPAEPLARVARTRIGWDALPGEAAPPPRSRRRVVVDFEGGPLAALPDTLRVEAVATTSTGEIADLRVELLPGGGRRATFSLRPDGERPADLRLFLRAGAPVTETWSYLWRP